MAITSSKVLKSFIWKFLEKCSVQLTMFIVTIILARILTPNEFGVIAIIIIFVNLANVIVEGGLTAALVQKKDADNVDFSTIFLSSLFLSVILYLVLYIGAPQIARFYDDENLISVIRVLAIIVVPCAINSVQKAYVSKYLLFGKMLICSFLAVLFSGIIGIILAYHDFGVWALVAQTIINQILVTILMFLYVDWRPQMVFSKTRFGELFDFGWKIFLSNFIIALYEDIRGLLIGKVFQPSVLAYFDRGKQFPSLIMGNINTSIQTVLFPTFSAEQDNLQRVKRMMRSATHVSCYVVFPLLLYLVISAEPLVEFLLTDKWLPSVPYIRIFAFAFILMPLQSSNMIAIKSLGYSNIILKLEIIKKIIEAFILIISFQYDAYAVAFGVLVYNFISLFINLYPNKKLLDYSIREQIFDILPILFVSLLSSFIAYWVLYLDAHLVIKLLVQAIVGAFIYIGLSWKFKIQAINIIVNIIKGLRR